MVSQAKQKPWIALLFAVLASPVAAMLHLGRGRRALAYLVFRIGGESHEKKDGHFSPDDYHSGIGPPRRGATAVKDP